MLPNKTKEGLATAKPSNLSGWKTGFEPAALGTTNRCSNQLSYNHHLESLIVE